MKFVSIFFIFILLINIVNAGCASWALRKMSDDYLKCYHENPNDKAHVRECLREWKYSIKLTDCTDNKFKLLFKEFCEAHSAGSFVCDI